MLIFVQSLGFIVISFKLLTFYLRITKIIHESANFIDFKFNNFNSIVALTLGNQFLVKRSVQLRFQLRARPFRNTLESYGILRFHPSKTFGTIIHYRTRTSFHLIS